jgi:hypothetical protein
MHKPVRQNPSSKYSELTKAQTPIERFVIDILQENQSSRKPPGKFAGYIRTSNRRPCKRTSKMHPSGGFHV